MSNQGDAGRALWPSTGASGAGVGGFGSECYVTGSESVPQITVAVIDSTGSYTYSFPSDQAEAIWPGITATTAADTLQASPAATPDSSPCKEPSSFCGVFAPFSQATTTQVGQGCPAPRHATPLAAPSADAGAPPPRPRHAHHLTARPTTTTSPTSPPPSPSGARGSGRLRPE